MVNSPFNTNIMNGEFSFWYKRNESWILDVNYNSKLLGLHSVGITWDILNHKLKNLFTTNISKSKVDVEWLNKS